MSEQVTVYVRAGDPTCAAALQYLSQRGVEHRVRDILTDPSASAILLARLGRVTVPAFQIGDRAATYLPQVWEQLPDKVEFLNHLAQKAGCAPDDWRGGNVGVSIYHVEAFAESN